MTLVRHVPLLGRVAAATLLCVVGFGGHTGGARVRAADSGPTQANTLSIGWAFEATGLDPVGYDNNPEIWTLVNIYDQLIRVAPDGKTLVPDLATSWNINASGTVYTFHLRPNVVFHNGAKLTAEDVKFDLDRARAPKAQWSWTLAAIKSVAAPNPSTVVITLSHPWSPLLSDLSLFDTGIYPEAYFKQVGAKLLATKPIGTGPYMLQEWKRGQYVLFKKNTNYFNAAAFPMQYVKYELVPNDNTRLLQVQTGELDVDTALPYNLIGQVQTNAAVQVQINPGTEITYLTFNTQVKPLNEANVRLAISHAIDRAAIVKAVLYGHGTPANSFMPAGAVDWNPNIPVPAHDLTLAKKLLAASSVPHGFTMTLEVPSGNSVYNEVAQIIQSEVAPLGITAHVVPVEQNTLDQLRNTGKFHSDIDVWTNDIPDPDEIVSYAVDFSSGGYGFYTWYNNPKLAALSRQAEQTSDSATRQKLYYQIQEIWAANQPMLALFYNPWVNALNKKVHGFSENPLGYFNLQGVTKS
jgi:peptide/nickel transport system substrate-binding protein